MKLPLQITFRNLDPSPAIEARVRRQAAKLDQFYDRIMSCHVVIEAPHKYHHKGKLYRIRIEVSLPGEKLVFSRVPDEEHAHEDVYVAIRDAFDAMRRQLEDFARRRRGQVKRHAEG